jgi:glycosyltransferase involved in cell wall biosynthesis
VPVITTRVGGLAEVVSDGGTGLLVPPGDPAALALAVTRYFREGCRERMAQAIEQARPRFDWQNLVMLIEEMVK